MKKPPLIWHPQWLTYRHAEQGMVLISKTDTLWLPFERFAGIEWIDGQRSADDIGALLSQSGQDVQAGAMFWYQLPKLFESQLLCQNPDMHDFYVSCGEYQRVLLAENDTVSAYSLSNNHQPWLRDLAASLITTIEYSGASLALVLVDDFVAPSLFEQVKPLFADVEQVLLVEVVAQFIAVSPLFDHSRFCSYWPSIVERLWQNLPVRQAFRQIYPQKMSVIPLLQCTEPYDDEHKIYLAEQLTHHCQQNRLSMLYLDVGDMGQGGEAVPLLLADGQGVSFAQQLQAPIVLQSCLSVFDSDGGSRSMTPSQTVERLLPLVHDKVGVITHLELLQETKNAPIKIYRTAFYKTPTAIQCEQLTEDMFTQSCLGKGVSSVQSRASALCETIERYNAHYRDDEQLLALCVHMSETQLANVSTKALSYVGYDKLLPICVNLPNLPNLSCFAMPILNMPRNRTMIVRFTGCPVGR